MKNKDFTISNRNPDLAAYYEIPGVDVSAWTFVGDGQGVWYGNTNVPDSYTWKLRNLALRITGLGE